jgi:methylated-DNA-protein-cysteine methyltransferase-like protein
MNRSRSTSAPRRAARAGADPAARQQQQIYAVVRAIPRGKVATYGQVAELAGIRSGHRIAARAMRSCPERLPWQRVVGKKDARRGQINIEDPDHAALQRGLLASEGIVFDVNGCIALARYGWDVGSTASRLLGPKTRLAKGKRPGMK